MTEPTTANGIAPHRTLSQIPGGELAALVTIETVERLVARASKALEAGDLDRVRALFGAVVDETTTRTCTAVKAQGVSDYIASRARQQVHRALDLVDEQLRQEAEAREAAEAHDAETDRAIAEHERELHEREFGPQGFGLPGAMGDPYPADIEDGEGLGLHRPSYGD